MAAAELHRRPTFVDLVVRSLRNHPDRAAFVTPDGAELSYHELYRLIARIAGAFTDAGVKAADGVAMLSPNRPEAFAALMAAMSVGARYTPLHPMGTMADHVTVCEDAGITTVIADDEKYAEHAAALSAALELRPQVLHLGGGSATDVLTAPDVDVVPAIARESDLALLGYTGGTTGRPKGVMLPHRSLVTHLFMSVSHWQLPGELRFLGMTPLTHALAGMVPPVFHQGGTVVLAQGFDPAQFCELVEKHRITATFLVPSMLYVLLDHVAEYPADLSSLQTILYGAAPMSPDRLAQALEVFGPVFVQFFGQSEAPNTVTVLAKEDHDLRRPGLLASCGKPHPSLEVAVLDEDDRPCPAGEVGEVCVRGPLVMDGYWRQPELTAETLRNGWLHTGDVGRFDEDNYLYLTDRKKDMVISGGFNIYPREVEDALTAHADVAAAAVIGIPDPKWGEAVTAFVVRAAGSSATPEELIAHVRELKGPVHAPKTLEFVDALPLTPLGKVDKKPLRARFWDHRDRAVN